MPGNGFRLRRASERPTRRFDITALRDILQDSRVWCALAVADTTGFEVLTDDSGNPIDILVDVRVMPRNESIQARLGNNGGLWRIPAPGTELAVLVPTGAWEDADPLIVAQLSGNAVPNGLNASTVVLKVDPGQQLLIIDGAAGDAKALATADHVHALPPLKAGATAVTSDSFGLSAGDVGAPDKVTSVLKAK